MTQWLYYIPYLEYHFYNLTIIHIDIKQSYNMVMNTYNTCVICWIPDMSSDNCPNSGVCQVMLHDISHSELPPYGCKKPLSWALLQYFLSEGRQFNVNHEYQNLKCLSPLGLFRFLVKSRFQKLGFKNYSSICLLCVYIHWSSAQSSLRK